MATARSGQDRLIPLVQNLSTVDRLGSRRTVAATPGCETRYRSPDDTSLITSHLLFPVSVPQFVSELLPPDGDQSLRSGEAETKRGNEQGKGATE